MRKKARSSCPAGRVLGGGVRHAVIVAADGWQGLLCRGLGTRLIANALQSALFAVVWKYIEAELNGSHR